MGRRVVLSLDFSVNPPCVEKELKSEGMRAAASFGHRLAMVAVMPLWLNLYQSGSPFENGTLYCNTPSKSETLKLLEKAKVVSIRLTLGTAPYEDAPDKPCAICEVYFKRDGKAFHKQWYCFDFATGECIGSGGAGANMFQEPIEAQRVEV